MTKRLAVLTHVFNAAEAVEDQVSTWRTLPPDCREQMEFLVVDDCSDQPLEVDRGDLPLRLLRVTTDIPWNMAGAKNLLRQQSTAPWMLFFDIDNHLPAAGMTMLVQVLDRLNPATLYMFARTMNGQPVETHINTFLVHRSVVDAVGGFDEDFCGHYGYEDVFFHHLVAQKQFGKILLNDLSFQQKSARIETLDRDLERNKELIESKAAQGLGTSQEQIRFDWVEL